MADVSQDRYDVGVIGCGPGGFAAAMRALDLGKHVCLVEGRDVGGAGAGVMWGALALQDHVGAGNAFQYIQIRQWHPATVIGCG